MPTDFQSSYSVRLSSKFAIKSLSMIPIQPKRVAKYFIFFALTVANCPVVLSHLVVIFLFISFYSLFVYSAALLSLYSQRRLVYVSDLTRLCIQY